VPEIKGKLFFPGEDACDSGLSTFSKRNSDNFGVLQFCRLERQFGFLFSSKSLVNQIAPSKS